jgi:hypothetical protein
MEAYELKGEDNMTTRESRTLDSSSGDRRHDDSFTDAALTRHGEGVERSKHCGS